MAALLTIEEAQANVLRLIAAPDVAAVDRLRVHFGPVHVLICAAAIQGPIGPFIDTPARANGWRIPEHFTADFPPLPGYNREGPAHPFRPHGAPPRHALEWARLALAPVPPGTPVLSLRGRREVAGGEAVRPVGATGGDPRAPARSPDPRG